MERQRNREGGREREKEKENEGIFTPQMATAAKDVGKPESGVLGRNCKAPYLSPGAARALLPSRVDPQNLHLSCPRGQLPVP